MDSVKLRQTRRPGMRYDSSVEVQVLAFHGELDISQKRAIEQDLARVEGRGIAVLDLSDVSYLDTTFLNASLQLKRRLDRTPHARLRIVAPSTSRFLRVFRVTRLDSVFDLFGDLASASL